MGLRESINDRPGLSTAVAAVGLALVAVVVVAQSHNHGAAVLPQFPTQAFYTTDDGATQFPDDINKVPPFDHGGQQAVRAWVFTADGGKHQWVQYLEKYSPDAKAQIARQQAAKESGPARRADPIALGIYVKRPGPGKWIRLADAKSSGITAPIAPPDMGTDVPRLVSP
jgi:hypothetical protein